MLYDLKRDDAISLTCVKDWLRSQPAQRTYDWGDGEACLMAQYLQSTGQAEPPMPSWYMSVTLPRPWTFGAALARAEDLT